MQPYQAAKRFYEDNEPDYKRLFAPPADTVEIQSLVEVLGPADPASNQVRDMGEASAVLASFYLYQSSEIKRHLSASKPLDSTITKRSILVIWAFCDR